MAFSSPKRHCRRTRSATETILGTGREGVRAGLGPIPGHPADHWSTRYPLVVEAVNHLKVRSCLIGPTILFLAGAAELPRVFSRGRPSVVSDGRAGDEAAKLLAIASRRPATRGSEDFAEAGRACSRESGLNHFTTCQRIVDTSLSCRCVA
jgi:hypothetical protein